MPIITRKFKSPICPLFIMMGLLAVTVALTSCQETKVAKESGSQARVSATPSAAFTSTQPSEPPSIVAFGDSLTAGYGLPEEEQRFTGLLQRKLDDKGYRYQIVNAGVSGDTSAGGSRRIDWVLQHGNVKFLILELGANDGLRGQPVAEMKKNLALIIERAQSRGVTVILAGMEAPPNLGEEYTREFRQAFQALSVGQAV
jgi:acyl-CoA thioesterase-1